MPEIMVVGCHRSLLIFDLLKEDVKVLPMAKGYRDSCTIVGPE